MVIKCIVIKLTVELSDSQKRRGNKRKKSESTHRRDRFKQGGVNKVNPFVLVWWLMSCSFLLYMLIIEGLGCPKHMMFDPTFKCVRKVL